MTYREKRIGELNFKDSYVSFDLVIRGETHGGGTEYKIQGNCCDGMRTTNKERALERWEVLTQRFLNWHMVDNFNG